jgi:hypothetical protein
LSEATAMQIKNRQQLFGIIAIGLLALWALDKIMITPLRTTWSERAKKIKSLEAKLADDKSLLNNSALLKGQWEDMKTNAFPRSTSAAHETLYSAFERWSTASKVNITNIKPATKESDDYNTIECSADATGTMTSIAQFLHEIEKDKLAIRIESLDLASHDPNGYQITLSLRFSGLLSPKEQ